MSYGVESRMPQAILVVNAGSSSVKFSIFDVAGDR